MVIATRIQASYEPTPRQVEAHTATQTWVLYGGAEGGGKTYWLAQEVLELLLEYPGIEGIIGRYDYQDVVSPTQIRDVFERICPKEIIEAEYRSPPSWVRLINDSRVTFTGLKDYQPSAEYGFFAVDQAEEVPEKTLRLLSGRIRQRLPDGRHPHFKRLLTCNPHPNMEWFIEAVKEHSKDYLFVPALPHENPYLPDVFFADRKRDYTADQYRRLIEGAWDVFEGQYFTEWERRVHVCQPFAISKDWPRMLGVDYGYGAPWAVLWGAKSPDGRVYIYRELYEAGVRADDQPGRILDLSEGETFRLRVGDPSMWQSRREVGLDSIAATYAKAGLTLAQADNNRMAGWQRVREYLAHDEGKVPLLQIFSTCSNLIRTLPIQVHDERKVEDLDTEWEDHAVDALRYMLMGAKRVRRGLQRPMVSAYGRWS